MQPQPNFEALKVLFYQAYYKSEQATNKIMLQGIMNNDFRSFNKKDAEFKKDFNEWLNGLDIRQAGTLIDILHKDNQRVPKWMANKQYYIDYNQHDALDLIRIETD